MIKIFLCRHKGFLAQIVRFFTKSDFDHITIKIDNEFHDFNYPYSYRRLGAYHLKPWQTSVKICEIEKEMMPLSDRILMKYSILCNLNYVFAKIGLKLRLKGDNCVTYVSKNLGIYNEKTRVMSPKELGEFISGKGE
jgi:hypothetical protein